MEVLLLCN